MKVAIIEVKWSPPIKWLDNVVGLKRDLGGFVYRIYDENMKLNVCGTAGKLKEDETVRRACEIAKKDKGYTHYKLLSGAGGIVEIPE
ncbi:hypothetical protein [Burkholderia contaminans]|uniref:hypothetical protein n=1 Tax=Burkholderia contaminans TaxID=488447 RepID=UPI00158952B0|nr:hypothetical protein [Burkholderia contaminans]